jgi:phosphoketolase
MLKRPRWPMIVLRSAKGWTSPRRSTGTTWRAHQIPIPDIATNPAHLKLLETWMRGYKPEELFDEQGQLIAELKDLAPQRVPTNERHSDRERRFTAQGPRSARLPQFRLCRQKTRGYPRGNVPTLGNFLREVMRLNMCNFRVFGPDETQSNRLEAIYEAGRKVWLVAPGKGQLFDQFARIQLVEVWFKLRAGGCICLERVTQPEAAQAALIHQLNWPLPQQPPPRIYKADFQNVWTT